MGNKAMKGHELNSCSVTRLRSKWQSFVGRKHNFYQKILSWPEEHVQFPEEPVQEPVDAQVGQAYPVPPVANPNAPVPNDNELEVITILIIHSCHFRHL
jgi:hypothetical protein